MTEEHSAKAAADADAPIAWRVARGAGWLVFFRVAGRVVGLFSLPILARILLPADFGLLAMAWATISLVAMFGALGIELALIRDPRAGRAEYDTAWTITVLIGALIAIATAVLAPYAASYFDEPALQDVLYALALSGLIGSFSNPGVIQYQKALKYGRVILLGFAERLSGTLATLLLAFLWRDYWALVCGVLVSSTVRCLASYLMHPYRPRFSLAAAPALLGFSKWLLVSNALSEFSRKFPVLMLGRYAGADIVAHYSVGNEIARLPTTELESPLRQALFPGLSLIASDHGRLRDAFLDIYAVSACVFLPLLFGIVVLSENLVLLLLGERWLPVQPFLEVLAMAAIVDLFRGNSRTIMLVSNLPRRAAFIAVSRCAAAIPAVLIGLYFAGPIGAAWGVLLSGALLTFLSLALVRRQLGFRSREFAARAWRPLAAGGLMALLILPLRGTLAETGDLASVALEAALLIGSGALVYTVALLSLWRISGRPGGAESRILALCGEARKRSGVSRRAAPSTPRR